MLQQWSSALARLSQVAWAEEAGRVAQEVGQLASAALRWGHRQALLLQQRSTPEQLYGATGVGVGLLLGSVAGIKVCRAITAYRSRSQREEAAVRRKQVSSPVSAGLTNRMYFLVCLSSDRNACLFSRPVRPCDSCAVCVDLESEVQSSSVSHRFFALSMASDACRNLSQTIGCLVGASVAGCTRSEGLSLIPVNEQ